jgi:hypothetical protein
VKSTSTGCKTRRKVPDKDKDVKDIVDNVAAKDAADRHMLELLEGVESQTEAKARASGRKRQKKKSKNGRSFDDSEAADLVEPSSVVACVDSGADALDKDEVPGEGVGADEEDRETQESEESFAPLASLWTKYVTGKFRNRLGGPCVMDVCPDDGNERATLTLAGSSLDLKSKDVLWMFAASTCACCEVRERELFCSLDSFDEAKDDFYGKYPKLKAVEAGSDVRGIGILEMMFQDGDSLAVGFDCAFTTRKFVKMCESLTTLCDLVKATSTGCKTRRKKPEQDVEHVTDDPAAQDEADRHMMELLEGVEFETVAKTRSSERKRQKKKSKSSNKDTIMKKAKPRQKPCAWASPWWHQDLMSLPCKWWSMKNQMALQQTTKQTIR